MDILLLVGSNIRRVRLARKLSQEALADAASVAPSFLSQIENGKRNLGVATLQRIAVALRTPVPEFFVAIKATPKGLPRGRRSR